MAMQPLPKAQGPGQVPFQHRSRRGSPPVNQSRQVVHQPPPPMEQPQPTSHGNEEEDDDDDFDEDNLEAIGYSAAHFLSLHRPKAEKKPKPGIKQYCRDMGDCTQLDHALQVLPPRPYTDMLVQHFLNIVNFHHYIIHPESFVKEYELWWSDRYQNKSLPLPWTSLLMMVCACSAQYPDPQLQETLERDLGQPMQKLSEKYHTAGRELYHTIPIGNAHLYTVQQLLHSCYWFKSEARYVDCWHALTSGIREAQELGIHQEGIVPVSSAADRELRRRAWCLLSIWDWQVGSLLSRPLILDPTECDVQLPGLSLEAYEPSPVAAMTLQAEIIWKLSRRFGRPTNVTTSQTIEEYKGMVERWISRFPQPYTMENTDKRMDAVCFWITLHRHYLHTTSYTMALDPMRPYLAKPMSRNSPASEQGIRRDGVKYALKLMSKLYEFFGFIYPRDAKFHSILFYIFDTAALLCSAVLHDQDHSLPRRDECMKAIEASLNMLKQIHTVSPTAKKPYEMLSRLTKKIDKQNQGPTDSYHRKRPRMVDTPVSTPAPPHTSPGPLFTQ
ncbi:putative transcription factor sol4-like protein [Cladobotryum mycophilum]|uniref:Transcription factor sol4-like protein n=1 Tax=Cladobotryum mycophilum TaxID=491253 RepID=A0ABR0SV69_9HYPO